MTKVFEKKHLLTLEFCPKITIPIIFNHYNSFYKYFPCTFFKLYLIFEVFVYLFISLQSKGLQTFVTALLINPRRGEIRLKRIFKSFELCKNIFIKTLKNVFTTS